MFEINDIVLHNRTELCRIEDVRTMSYPGGERISCYVLKPVYEDTAGSSTLYVPVNAPEERLCRAFSAAELKEMLVSPAAVRWIESSMIRKKEFNDILSRNHPRELIALIRTVQEKRMEKQRAGQRFSESDEKYLNIAEKRLFPLFKYILNAEWEDFLGMIIGQ